MEEDLYPQEEDTISGLIKKKRRHKMNKTMRVSAIVVITVGLLLALTISGLAARADTFTLTYEFPEVNWDTLDAVGTFELVTSGGTQASGEALLRWVPGTSPHGTMIFLTDTGQAVVRYVLARSVGDDCFTGQFYIAEWLGTGEFENLHGRGDIEMCRPDWGDRVYGVLNGWASVDGPYYEGH
jgi:hypothetical protein